MYKQEHVAHRIWPQDRYNEIELPAIKSQIETDETKERPLCS